jgi:hypothetical protein
VGVGVTAGEGSGITGTTQLGGPAWQSELAVFLRDEEQPKDSITPKVITPRIENLTENSRKWKKIRNGSLDPDNFIIHTLHCHLSIV